MNIQTNHLWAAVASAVVFPDFGSPFTVNPGDRVWLHASRKGTMGYVGTFSRTYEHSGNQVSPKGEVFTASMANFRQE